MSTLPVTPRSSHSFYSRMTIDVLMVRRFRKNGEVGNMVSLGFRDTLPPSRFNRRMSPGCGDARGCASSLKDRGDLLSDRRSSKSWLKSRNLHPPNTNHPSVSKPFLTHAWTVKERINEGVFPYT